MDYDPDDYTPFRYEFTYLSDPGHGWIAVPGRFARDQGFADKISAYSYYDRNNDTIWLEEDCDAGLLLDWLHKSRIPYDLIETYTEFDAPIRNLPRWSTK